MNEAYVIHSDRLIEFLRRSMEEQGWSMRETSAHAGLSSGRISQIMNGDLPGIEACIGIARAFGITPEYVMFLAGYLKNDPAALDPEIEAIARRIAEAPSELRQAAIRVVLAVLGVDEP